MQRLLYQWEGEVCWIFKNTKKIYKNEMEYVLSGPNHPRFGQHLKSKIESESPIYISTPTRKIINAQMLMI